jgi:DNA-directed RNA polymerase specialized sigma24 family protein
LREYALRNSEAAFATLVSRHIDLVYSAALRQVGNHHHAQEVTQAVFVILARKARTLGSGTLLPGCLFRTARLTAANYLRSELRRIRREQEAYLQSKPHCFGFKGRERAANRG